MYKTIFGVVLTAMLFSGCASVPMEDATKSVAAKRFDPPPHGRAGLYIYRPSSFGGALKKSIWVNGNCIGESAPYVFFYTDVKGGPDHKISTESEFSPNHLILKTRKGQNYFIRQYIKLGVFVGGAGLTLVSNDEGKREVTELNLAKKGNCR